MCFADNESIIRWRWQVTEGIFKSYLLVVILWKSIMPVGGRVAGKGVGVHNSGGSSDGKSGCAGDERITRYCWTRSIYKDVYTHTISLQWFFSMVYSQVQSFLYIS